MKDFTPTNETISLHGLGFIQLKLDGLSPGELWCVVHGKRWREMPADDAALAWLKAWLENDVVELIAKFIEKHPDVAPLELVVRIRNGEWWQ